MKNILIVTEGFSNGGAEKSLSDFLCNVDLSGLNIEIFCLTKSSYNLKLPKNILIKYANEYVLNFFSPIIKSIKYFLKKKKLDFIFKRLLLALLARINYRKVTNYSWNCIKKTLEINKKKYDVAIAFKDGLCWYYTSEFVNSEKKYAWNHVEYKYIKSDINYDKSILNKFNKVFCVSKASYNHIKKYFGFENKFQVLYNYINTNEIISKSKQDVINNVNTLKITTVGRLAKEKGYSLVLKACKKLKVMNTNFIWYILGDGNEYGKIKKFVLKNSLEKNVILLGSIDNPYPYMKQCDLYVQPSRYEGFGLTLSEAKILSKRIIATNIPQFLEQDDGLIAYINFNLKELIDKIMHYENLVPIRENYNIDYNDSLLVFKQVINGNL